MARRTADAALPEPGFLDAEVRVLGVSFCVEVLPHLPPSVISVPDSIQSTMVEP